MLNYYVEFVDTSLVIVIVLLLMAIVDLTVGVANDAVNFLNSAIGSKAAKFRTIMIVAALGVFIGVTLSSGMMEVARKGIFNPEMFIMAELLIIFLAVMYQDILLLDLFNTLGLPTSTTVSIVFGLFGSSLAIAGIKTIQAGGNFFEAFRFINSANLLAIISAILVSIVLAFIVGYIIQYFSRLLFTFNYSKTFRKFGSLWSAIALTSISIFILQKGIKGSPFVPDEVTLWIKNNIALLSAYIFVGWAIIIQLLLSFSKVNVLKIVVLAGTFSLAMAFAANDLVNFIGAPLAGLKAYEIAQTAGDPLTSMLPMTEKFPANTWLLLLSGFVMVTTLFLSKKARAVAMTTIDLSSQNAGSEKFESNMVAREIVKLFIRISKFIVDLTPKKLRNWVKSRFDLVNYKPEVDDDGDMPAFDLIRAAVILMVAAGLISLATSLKLPLSTTYVTFIVAMAAALPDKAWGRETAVYRVSGVVTVIAGWFVTAIAATLVAGIIALILFYTSIFGVMAILGLIVYILLRTHLFSNKQHKNLEDIKNKAKLERLNNQNPVLGIIFEISVFLDNSKAIIIDSYNGLIESQIPKLREARDKSKSNTASSLVLINNVLKRLKDTPDEDDETEFAYTQALGTFQDITDRLEYISRQNYSYINNQHEELSEEQKAEVTNINNELEMFFSFAVSILKDRKFEDFSELETKSKEIKRLLKLLNKRQLQRIKESTTNMKRSRLYLTIIADSDAFRIEVTKLVQASKSLYIQAKKYDPGLK